MKSTLTALLAICLCLPLMGDDAAKKKFEETKVLAEKGDKIAQHNLGVMYDKGEGVPQDFKEAVKWFRKAAEQGLKESQFYVGVMYNRGKGVPQDDKEAVKWYRKAAEQGHATAQYTLGQMYTWGTGVPKDYVTAYSWFNIAAAKGRAFANEYKGKLSKKMTGDQIAKAQELSKEMLKKNPKLLK